MRQKIIYFVCAIVVMLFALPAYASIPDQYSFSGGCYKYFTTGNQINRPDTQVPDMIEVNVNSLSFSAPTTYNDAKIQLVDQAGNACCNTVKSINISNSPYDIDDITTESTTTAFKLKVMHPYYASYNSRASYRMQISGNFRAYW